MAILVGPETRILCQGMTGRTASFHTARALAYGTKIVAGVRPGKGGQRHLDLPVFNNVSEAVAATGANASMIFVPAPSAAAAMIEAIEAEIPLAVVMTERVPVLDMVRVRDALRGAKTRLVGPNSQGVLVPGICKIGVMSTVDARPGRIGIVSRSASLTSEIVAQTSAVGLGQSITIGIGGDPVHGLGFVDCLKLLRDDAGTEGVILIGEIGGTEEEEAAEYLIANPFGKPIVALVAGRHAPQVRRMGHAGTLNVFAQGTAKSKAEALRQAGVQIASDADAVASLMRKALSRG